MDEIASLRADFEAWLTGAVLDDLMGLGALLLLCGLVHLLTRRLLVSGIRRFVARSSTTVDDALVDAELFQRLAMIVPALVATYGVQLLPGLSPTVVLLVQRIAASAAVVVVVLSASAFLNAANDVYSKNPEYRHRPIKGYVQLAKIVLGIAAAVLVVAILMDRSPFLFLSGLAGMTAVLLLIFKDTILSLVASVQLTSNDMLHVGDWIEMPKYQADGDVIDIALHTVKVQNWDKTITTIPTHAFISDSFKNWRGMSNAHARRIKRALYVDMRSVRFLEDEEVERCGRMALLRDYVRTKRKELAEWNEQDGRDRSINADIRRLTNVGTFRAYLLEYLRNHPKIDSEHTLIVRQLAPTAQGLPIEIYCFSNDIAWASYEGIQSDLFDHFIAIAHEFDLRLFQELGGNDLEPIAASA